jgi:hypothetical protein
MFVFRRSAGPVLAGLAFVLLVVLLDRLTDPQPLLPVGVKATVLACLPLIP